MKIQKYSLLGTFLVCLCFMTATAQDVYLHTQTEVNVWPGYTSITGDLFIQGVEPDDIVDLTPLSTLTAVGGNLTIFRNFNLPSLAGLENLVSVGGYIDFRRNLLLTDCNGLNNLTSVGGDLLIQINPLLTSLTGLENLRSVGDNVVIRENESLQSTTGLNQLQYVGQNIRIDYNPLLTTINDLENLTVVRENVLINDNELLASIPGLNGLETAGALLLGNLPALNDISGLSNLQSLDSYLLIHTVNALTDINSLTGLSQVGENILIAENQNLVNLYGLSNLTHVGGYMAIYNNASLSLCAIPAICLEIASSYDIHDNAPGCNNLEEICPATLPELEEEVENLDLPAGIENALISKLEAAEEACARGNETAAINQLNAFINQVEAQSGKKIPMDDADALIEMAEAIIATGLDCDVISPPTFLGPSSRPTNTSWYPNPTNGFIFSNHPFSHAVIFNALGQEVLVQEQGNEIDLSNQKPGVYFLRVDGELLRILKL